VSMRNLIIILALFFHIGCSQEEKPENTIPANVGNKEVADSLTQYLIKNEIWYEVNSDTSIQIPYPPPPGVLELINSEHNKVLPKGRSFAYSNDIHDTLIDRASGLDIEFTTKCFDEMIFIIWAKESDILFIEELVSEITMELFTKNNGVRNDKPGNKACT